MTVCYGGVWIPIIDTRFIESKYCCLLRKHFVSSSYPKTQPLGHDRPTAARSNPSQRLVPTFNPKIRFRPCETTLRKTLQKVVTRKTSSDVPGNRYHWNAQNVLPLRRCGFNVDCPTVTWDRLRVWQSSESRIEIVSTCDLTYKAWSRWWMREGILNKV